MSSITLPSGGTPAAPNGAIQFNNGGVFGGNSSFTYTGPTTTGAATNTDGVNILGTLNTSGVVDGAALFANITNSSSGAGTLLFDLQVNSSSVFNIDMSGNVTIAGAGEVSSNTSLTIAQTGDTFGPTAFRLTNRSGFNGATFEQLGTVSLVDFIFNVNGSGGNNGSSNIRYERRSASFMISGSTNFEFQFAIASGFDARLVVGDHTVAVFADPAGLDVTFDLLGSYSVLSTACNIIFSPTRSSPGKNLRFETTTANFSTTANTVFEFEFSDIGAYTGASGARYLTVGDTVVFFTIKPQFHVNTTGAGSALLGANCPAVTVTAPYTWIEALSSDGSLVYIPAWK